MPHKKFSSCIQACYACAEACNHCAVECLQEQDVKMMARCIALDIDCAQICEAAASAMARASESAKSYCELCAKACDQCAAECERHSMSHCKECAQACRRCAQECRQMMAMA